MPYTIKPIKKASPQKERNEVQPESWGGWTVRNTAGGINNILDTAGQAVRIVGDPHGYMQNQILSRLGYEKPINTQAPQLQYLQPKHEGEQLLQDLIGALALSGAGGDIQAVGKTGLDKAQSFLSGIGNTTQNYLVGRAGHYAGEGLSDITGASDIPYAGQAIKALSGLSGSFAAPGIVNALKPSALTGNLKQVEAKKYNQSRNKPNATTNQRELRKALEEGLDLEHTYDFPRSESNRKNLEGGLNKFRIDGENIDSSIHKPQQYSNYDLQRAIKTADKVDLTRNVILEDLFPGKNIVKEGGTLDANKLKSIYKDDIKLNGLFDFKKNINAINYKSGREASPALKNVERVAQKGITNAASQYPEQVEALRGADNIKKFLAQPPHDNIKLWQKAVHSLFKASKHMGIGKLLESGYLTYKSFQLAAPETRQFIADNVIDTMKNNPGIFSKEIREFNNITEKVPAKITKKGFTIRPIH